MNRFASNELWTLVRKYSRVRVKKYAAIAYVASDEHLAFRKGDVLVTDASDPRIAGGQTSAKVLKAAHEAGAELYSLPELHAKAMCLGRHVVIGSANVSESSVNNLVEACVVSDDPRLRSETVAFIEQLKKRATPIDKAFLRRVAAIKVVRSRPPRVLKTKAKVNDPRARVWLVGVSEDEPPNERDPERAAHAMKRAKANRSESRSTIEPIWYTGSSKFRREAQPYDLVIQVWSETGSKVTVWEPARIRVRDESSQSFTDFYLEEPRGSEGRTIPWRDFRAHWKSLVGTKVPSQRGARELLGNKAERIIALWRE